MGFGVGLNAIIVQNIRIIITITRDKKEVIICFRIGHLCKFLNILLKQLIKKKKMRIFFQVFQGFSQKVGRMYFPSSLNFGLSLNTKIQSIAEEICFRSQKKEIFIGSELFRNETPFKKNKSLPLCSTLLLNSSF